MALVRPALLHQWLDQHGAGQPLVEVVCWNSVIMSSSTGVVGDATPSFSNHLHFKTCMAHVESSILSLNLKCTLCFPPYSFPPYGLAPFFSCFIFIQNWIAPAQSVWPSATIFQSGALLLRLHPSSFVFPAVWSAFLAFLIVNQQREWSSQMEWGE